MIEEFRTEALAVAGYAVRNASHVSYARIRWLFPAPCSRMEERVWFVAKRLPRHQSRFCRVTAALRVRGAR